MIRSILRLLLLASLLANGAWPSGAMAHAHAVAVMPSAVGDCHGTTHHDVATQAADPSSPSHPVERSCCDGGACPCGCILSSAPPVGVAATPASLGASAPAVPALLRIATGHDRPPLRPPAA